MNGNEEVYPGIPSLATFTPKKAKPVQFDVHTESDATYSLEGPAANILAFPTEYLIQVAVPGLKRENFNIELSQGVIRISAKREEEGSCCITDRLEFSYQDWTRAFILPVDADAIMTQAIYQNGALFIHIPRDEKADNNTFVTVTVY